ncbi:MAG: hydroxyacid dehydrogenase [Alphaproteobacteria bacterium]|nr:hydroxyacid dehydrogenase [Alphaproteobacteria bacterium]
MQNVHKVLVVGPLPDSAMALFEARDDIEATVLADVSDDNLKALMRDASGMTLRGAAVTEDMIRNAENLKVVSRLGVGYDKVHIPSLTERGAALTVVGEANSVNVAELALYLMLELTKLGKHHDRAIRDDDWGYRLTSYMSELWEKKVLIVGFGRIGSRVAPRCRAFDMDVLVCDPYIDQKLITDAGCTPVADFRSVLSEVDYVTLHTPLTEETEAMIGADELRQMKNSAVLINCARGGLVDEPALIEALRSGEIRAAGLDVLAKEPPDPDNPILELDNVLMTPHMGGNSREAVERGGLVCVQNVIDAIDGCLNPDYVINKEVLKRG